MSSRRDFLKASLGASTLVSLAPSVPTFLARAAEAAAAERSSDDTILIVLQLAGGNDGLNTVVPYGDDLYAKARPTLRQPARSLHKIDDHLGFHEELTGFARLFKEGLLNVVQGVGYPNPHGGHGESMLVYQTAKNPFAGCQTGWVGRAVDSVYQGDQTQASAVYVGEIAPPLALNGKTTVIPTIRRIEDCTLQRPAQAAGDAAADPLLDYVRRSALAAQATHEAIASAAKKETRPAEYPDLDLAKRLQIVARLIRSDLGIRIFYTEHGGQEPGGYDTHAGQAANHGALLRQLSQSVTALVDDLKRDGLLDRVLLMTFSEFGRTVQENGRRGTDHGSAQPIFLAGGRLRGGLIGKHPPLDNLENNGQRHHTDFRRLYATALETWLRFDRSAILGDYPPLEVLRG